MLKKQYRFIIAALLAGWAFDLLFWHKTPGISFALYIGALLAIGLALSYSEAKPPARASLWLLAPIITFAGITTLRLEPITVFTSVCLAVALLMLLVHTFRGGRWVNYSMLDLWMVGLRLFESAVTLPAKVDWRTQSILPIENEVTSENEESDEDKRELPQISETHQALNKRAYTRILLAVLRGLLLALPIVVVFGSLLASADPVFENQIKNFLELFSLKKLAEYAWRGIYVLILAYILLGQYLHALSKSANEKLIGLEKPLLGRFLGFLEAGIVLGSVNLLFLSFVIVQFQYFFGGQANISYAGLNYSQYARRGFGELVVVACFSLLLFLSLSTITRREKKHERRIYSWLGVFLSLLVGVILVSAFQRLLLYESAFGFTRLRTYPHVFMVWLGLLLLAFVILEIINRQRAFGLALLLACVGFGLTLGFVNVDGLIVRQNFKHAQAGAELDIDYLLTLSSDSTPALVSIFTSSDIADELRDSAGAVLACQAAALKNNKSTQTWTGFHFARMRSKRLLITKLSSLENYQVHDGESGIEVILDGATISCQGRWWLD